MNRALLPLCALFLACPGAEPVTGPADAGPPPPVCGNGELEGDEACDDGNRDPMDACLNDCQPARCGDGFLHEDVEACEDGNSIDSDACLNNCELAVCGDGVQRTDRRRGQSGYEACDDGNSDPRDACLDDCVAASCGDGLVWAGEEECDDGDDDDRDGCLTNCQEARCGDGVAQLGVDACDDGDSDDADACRNNCRLARCGDGVLRLDLNAGEAGHEECDDGNREPADGCSEHCLLAVCGNDRVDVGETCDDGNDDEEDGCLNDCSASTGFVLNVSMYSGHSCAVMADGSAYCWGSGGQNQLGNGAFRQVSPVPVLDLPPIRSIRVGYHITCALARSDGQAYCWGEVGDLLGPRHPRSPVPRAIEGADGLVELGTGAAHACGRRADGTVLCWGDDSAGQLGEGPGEASFELHELDLDGVTKVQARGSHSCALTEAGHLYCWGSNHYQQTYPGQAQQVYEQPTRVEPFENLVDIAVGNLGVAMVDGDGGVHYFGELGGGNRAPRSPGCAAPYTTMDCPILGMDPGLQHLDVGSRHSCALTAAGQAQCWGGFAIHHVGNDGGNAPFIVPNPSDLRAVAAGDSNSCVVTRRGDLFCWGQNRSGQAGIGHRQAVTSPVQVIFPEP